MSVGPMELWLKVANLFRGSGWPDGAVVFALATLPVIELRGAIHVGYWLQLNPVLLTALPVLELLHFPNIIFITYAVDYNRFQMGHRLVPPSIFFYSMNKQQRQKPCSTVTQNPHHLLKFKRQRDGSASDPRQQIYAWR
ncbi:hypothetical protein L1987_77038 [Smallanthus sonchifolius]|uniref:Uncharacterized protein n=1 Tax=Smallanthus sonchifolius TaxID=185202 RepID=A0ACB8Z7W8_9ASTR|nr:hypothetical protein L1987_77038 [Smallanthus sonchifolius]